MKAMVEQKDLKGMSTPELRQKLIESLAMTAERLLELANVVAELENRGEDLSNLRVAMISYLRAIAAKTLLPEAVVQYAGRPRLLSIISTLSIDTQREILKNDKVPVVLVSKTTQETKMICLSDLPERLTNQVFTDGRLRNEDEQLVYLSAKPSKAKKEPTVKRKAKADFDTGGIKIGNAVASKGEVIMALESMAGALDPIAGFHKDAVVLSVKVKPDELKKIKKYTKETGKELDDAVRGLFHQLGVI